MRHNSRDKTLKRNYIQKYRYLIEEYEQVKRKEHCQYHFVKDFYKAHGVYHQTFSKYYNRYKQSKEDTILILRKRVSKYKSRRVDISIEHRVLKIHSKGLNKYKIHDIVI